jgi:hypothetical protein
MESKGLGDTIAKITHALRIDEAVKAIAGAEGCGCEERREYLNKLFPYVGTIRKIKFKEDYKFNGFLYLKGSIHSINKEHILYPHILKLAENGKITEV